MSSNSVSTNIQNAFEVVRKTYENIEKLLAELDRQGNELSFEPVLPQVIRWKSDLDYNGWLINSFFKLYQKQEATPCDTGNGWKDDVVYAIEISLKGEPVLNVCKYSFINMESVPRASVSLYDKGNFSDITLENGKTKSVPIDDKVSEKYLGIEDVVWKEIDLISIISSNIKKVVFEELQSL
ncbi:hypothetical protein [Bacillus toyonensis]|uniref:hypothetical protein n=1 Tax=Bacillus toyonensis TaxID=155322 RepID=UPI0021D30F4F|nr:hypothetical protein [Bacillus toyonensis]MCU4768285.1 hypothetical protein [Bacillus toyonensis]